MKWKNTWVYNTLGVNVALGFRVDPRQFGSWFSPVLDIASDKSPL